MTLPRILVTHCIVALTLAFASSAIAQSPAPTAMMTEKKIFDMPSYTTFGGKTIKNVKVGYETYGKQRCRCGRLRDGG